MDKINEFLVWEQLSRDSIDVKRVYIDIVEDLVAGILLSQIIFWNLPNQEGKSKLRVKKDGELWLAKNREDWYEECRISVKQYDRASRILEKKGLIEKRIFKFNGNPTTHIKLNLDKITQCLSVIAERGITILPKGEEPYCRKGNNHIAERGRSITEITTEITTENNNNTTEISVKEEIIKTNVVVENTKEEIIKTNVVVENENGKKNRTIVGSADIDELIQQIRDVTDVEHIHLPGLSSVLSMPDGIERLQKAVHLFPQMVQANVAIKNPVGFLCYIATNNIVPPKSKKGKSGLIKKIDFNNFSQHANNEKDLDRLFELIE